MIERGDEEKVTSSWIRLSCAFIFAVMDLLSCTRQRSSTAASSSRVLMYSRVHECSDCAAWREADAEWEQRQQER